MDQDKNKLDQHNMNCFFQKKLASYEWILDSRTFPGLAPGTDIRAYRQYVEMLSRCAEAPQHKLLKCPIRAAALRREGNELYKEKKYDHAMIKYNESICAAPNDSEDLAIGYANRSAAFYEKKLYGATLLNIELAKKHNYPDRLMPKLLTRESNCRPQFEETIDEIASHRIPSVTTKLEPNSKIPFLANGIIPQRRATDDPTIMVAERDFKVGDVLLHEKPLVACISDKSVFSHCNHCASNNMYHLIPCPNCTWAMFCNEECLREGQKLHRFECGICSGMSKMHDQWMGPRMFFYGLSLFNDDVTKMMEFCKEIQGTESSFLDLDYSNYDALDEFRTFLTTKIRKILRPKYDDFLQFHAAVIFGMYMEVPLVRKLITSEEQKDFMQQCFFDYQCQSVGLHMRHNELRHLLYPIASCFGHSCDPNTTTTSAVQYRNELKIIVQRPIRRGDQIHLSYGPAYDQSPDEHQYQIKGLGFVCVCDFCDEKKRRTWMAKAKKPSTIHPDAWAMVKRVTDNDATTTSADKMNALKQFIQRYGSSHPQEDFAEMVQLYATALEASQIVSSFYDWHRKNMPNYF